MSRTTSQAPAAELTPALAQALEARRDSHSVFARAYSQAAAIVLMLGGVIAATMVFGANTAGRDLAVIVAASTMPLGAILAGLGIHQEHRSRQIRKEQRAGAESFLKARGFVYESDRAEELNLRLSRNWGIVHGTAWLLTSAGERKPMALVTENTAFVLRELELGAEASPRENTP